MYINESRKNKDVYEQLKTSSIQQLKRYSGFFVTMVNVEKVGLNPKSTINDVAGVYSYPVDYVIKNNIIFLPHAAQAKFMFIINPKKDIIKSSTYNNFENDFEKIKQFLNQKNLPEIKPQNSTSQFQSLWNTITEYTYKIFKKNSAVKASALFRVLGYEILYDDSNMGYINENEPTQCLFLTPSSYEVIDKIYNDAADYDESSQGQFEKYRSMLMTGDINYSLLDFIKANNKFATRFSKLIQKQMLIRPAIALLYARMF